MISSNITKLERKAGGRVDVYADGQLLMTVSENAAADFALYVGMELDADAAAKPQIGGSFGRLELVK